jgi:hypothetical protein
MYKWTVLKEVSKYCENSAEYLPDSVAVGRMFACNNASVFEEIDSTEIVSCQRCWYLILPFESMNLRNCNERSFKIIVNE